MNGFSIGSVKVPNLTVLAPMAGVSDLSFRVIAHEHGCGLVCGEMISAKGLIYHNRNTAALLATDPAEHPVALQLFGGEPAVLAAAARLMTEMADFEILDLNMGCPVPKVVKNCEGSALMRRPQLVGEIVSAVCAAVPKPVTVKIRKGWDEENVNAAEVAKIAADAGAKAIMVHGRTRVQFYEGQADWEIIKQVKAAVQVPVIGNGDIRSPQDAQRMLTVTGCDAIAVGRAARGNPWLFARINHYLTTGELLPEPTPEERITQAIDHLHRMVDFKGEHIAVLEMRKHMAWYLHGLPHAGQLRTLLNSIEQSSTMENILKQYLEELNQRIS